MNYVASEMKAILNESSKEDFLAHEGVGHLEGGHSGRFPWGSGENPYQHATKFIARYNNLMANGLTEAEIAKYLKCQTKDLRTALRIAKHQEKLEELYKIKEMSDKGMTPTQIGKKLGMNESSVRNKLSIYENNKAQIANNTADILVEQIKKKGFIDVGAATEHELGVTRDIMDEAVMLVEAKGLGQRYDIRQEQVTNKGKYTTMQVLCPWGTEYKDVYEARDNNKIETIKEYTSDDGGKTYRPLQKPASFDSSRLAIRYADDPGKVKGTDKDGVIELRRGCADLSLGDAHYAQVRILVDGKYYLKGMAVYSDDLPEGKDILFNTNKKSDKSMAEVLKPIKTDDPMNPFGSTIAANGQSYYIDKNGKEKLSPVNKTREEGEWETWSKELPSQFLAKQDMKLITNQLNLSKADKRAELEEIKSLTNPIVKRHYLDEFASNMDSASIHLKAATLPGQRYSVILPLSTIKDTEVYAPRFKDGTKLALVRFPHEGTFQIPILTVNNNNREGKKVITPTSADAVGISASTAERLSGADFDGDTVLTIPLSSKVKVTNSAPLKGLEGFDPKTEYPAKEGMKPAWKKGSRTEQNQMGKISNLIMDMTLQGAQPDELARATRHSMTIIDTAKHNLDWRESEKRNGIKELKKKYQEHYDLEGNLKTGGASTLITRAKNEVHVPGKTVGAPRINKETGEKEQYYREEKYINKKTGKETLVTHDMTQMELVKDAHKLSTGTPQEEAYADYANFCKALANEARKEKINTKTRQKTKEATEKYRSEVDSLDRKLKIAESNAPRERKAQQLAGSTMRAIEADNTLSDDQKKKYRDQHLKRAREAVGAKRQEIYIKDNEWKAIQEGAISGTKLEKMLKYTDKDRLRELSLPKETKSMSKANTARVKAMQAAGYTLAEIAERLDCSTSTVSRYLKS